MIIESIKVQNEGYVYCKSKFYSAQDGLSNSSNYILYKGINKLVGEIDSGLWAVSYMLSMYTYRPEDFILFEYPSVIVNGEQVSLTKLSEYSCYMDKLYPLFSTDDSIRALIEQGLEKSHMHCTSLDIKDLFYLDSERFERPLTGAGNEIFRAMTAIGYSCNKEIFCFPWLSHKRFESYHANLTELLHILEKLKKIVILPIGVPVN